MKRLLVPLLALALALPGLPAPSARADDSSEGAVISVGLLAAVVVVYGLVALRSDVENLASNPSPSPAADAIERAVAAAQDSPLLLQTVSSPSSGTPDGAALAWKISF